MKHTIYLIATAFMMCSCITEPDVDKRPHRTEPPFDPSYIRHTYMVCDSTGTPRDTVKYGEKFNIVLLVENISDDDTLFYDSEYSCVDYNKLFGSIFSAENDSLCYVSIGYGMVADWCGNLPCDKVLPHDHYKWEYIYPTFYVPWDTVEPPLPRGRYYSKFKPEAGYYGYDCRDPFENELRTLDLDTMRVDFVIE